MTSTDLDSRIRAALAAALTPAQLAMLDERRELLRTKPGRLPAQNAAHHLNRPRQAVLLVAATIALLVGTAVMTAGAPDPAVQAAQESAAASAAPINLAAEERIGDDIAPLFAGCASLAQATTEVWARLVALGYLGWSIETRDGGENARCVTASVSADVHAVYLIPSMGGTVRKAIDGLTAQLMSSCLDLATATALISSTLTGLGVTRFSVRSDGPVTAPIGQEAAIEDHIAAGCAVYSGSQSQSDGGWDFFITGG